MNVEHALTLEFGPIGVEVSPGACPILSVKYPCTRRDVEGRFNALGGMESGHLLSNRHGSLWR